MFPSADWLGRIFRPAFFFLALVCPLAAHAHFSEGGIVRKILLVAEEGGYAAYVMTPLPLVFSDLVTGAKAENRPLSTPFLYFEPQGGSGRYRLSADAVATDPAGFRARLSGALLWNDKALEVTDFRLLVRAADLPFATGEEAATTLAGADTRLDAVFGEAVVIYRVAADGGPLAIRAGYPPLALPPNVEIDNHLTDARGAEPVTLIFPGQLEQAVVLDGSWVSQVATYLWQGVVHILGGLDHVALVLCLGLGLGPTRGLFWAVTAFTLGHSVTLIAGFLGYVPSVGWFIPLVEAAIAATILYAAAAALMGRADAPWVMAGVGLLHGFGFSFVLGDILGRDAPNLVTALAAFNVGIEVGQLMILAALFALGWVAMRVMPAGAALARQAALVGIGGVALFWVVERTAGML